MKTIIIGLIAVMVLIVGCSTEETSWKTIETNSFTLQIPENWEFNELQGMDSYVGELTGDNTKLMFDFGWYSNPLELDDHTITYETIDGYQAKIVVPKETGTTGVYFADLGDNNKFSMVGNDLTEAQQETALKIFRTIKIK